MLKVNLAHGSTVVDTVTHRPEGQAVYTHWGTLRPEGLCGVLDSFEY